MLSFCCVPVSEYSKTATLKKDQKIVFKTNYRLMQVKSICRILLTFIKLRFVIKIFVLSIFEWPFYTGFTVLFYPFYALFKGRTCM